MSDADTVIQEYFAAWNERDPARRRALAEKVWAPTGRYADPQVEVSGPDRFTEMVGSVQEQIPGHTVRLTSSIDQHHDQLRFLWDVIDPQGAVVLFGIDFAQLAGDGRLQSLTGFIGELSGGSGT